MRTFEEIKQNPRIAIDAVSEDGAHGTISLPGWLGSVIFSTGAGWEHVSVAPYKARVMPSYEDMCKVKEWFFTDDEAVIHVFPAKKDHVNNLNNCLHLWRCTYKDMVLPPSVLVGVRKGQTRQEIMKELKEAYEMAGEEFRRS